MKSLNDIIFKDLSDNDIIPDNQTYKLIEVLSNSIEKWIVEEYSPEIQKWIIGDYSQSLQDWLIKEFIPALSKFNYWSIKEFPNTFTKMFDDNCCNKEVEETEYQEIKD